MLTSPGATPMWNCRTSRPTAFLSRIVVPHRQLCPSLAYGRPTAAGAMLRPTTPARMTIVTMYGNRAVHLGGDRLHDRAQVGKRRRPAA